MSETEWEHLQNQFEKAEDGAHVDFGEFLALVQQEGFYREVLVENLIKT